MKVYSNDIPRNCRYLTNGKHYEFRSESLSNASGYIVDDQGDEILVLTEMQDLGCAFLSGRANWKIVK